jgi:hypothetical protein
MATVIAIDPGYEKSAIVEWDGEYISNAEILPNDDVLKICRTCFSDNVPIIIEWIESYGMAVGKEVFVTCRWCGRFEEAYDGPAVYLTRKQVKSHLCHTIRANDSNIRQALIDRFGPPGTKKMPGITYGLKKDLWAAFALAVTWWDQNGKENKP